MAVYYKFKSARDYDSIALDGPFISVGTLKEKFLNPSTWAGVLISTLWSQTPRPMKGGGSLEIQCISVDSHLLRGEYLDDAMLIPKNTSVLIRRVPGRPRMPIVTQQEPKFEDKVEEIEAEKTSVMAPDSSVMRYTEDSEWDEFGNDLYAIPEVLPAQSSNPIVDAPPTNKADEDSKIKALIDTSALDWTRGSEGFGSGRGFGRGAGGRMGGRGFGFEKRTLPPGYVCHRCKVPGHFIQHCPTNGDPNYDVKRVKPPTGIPKSMLMATPDGSYALPSGAVAVLKPNEAAFEREIEGLPSTRSVGDLPPELHCPLCKEVMKDAVLTSKCCFKSFCDKCIRNHIISKSSCVCGATNILADDLLPNKTLRDTINRILESGNSSAENAGSIFQVQDMESARSQPKAPSPTLSAASKGEQKLFLANEEASKTKVTDEEGKALVGQQVMFQKVRNPKVVDVSEATHESISVKEAASQGSAPLAEEEVQQRLASGEAGKKKKKKKIRPPTGDLLWKTPQDLAFENYMMPMGPTPYNSYWTGVQPGLDGYMAQYTAPMPYMGYGLGPLDMGFGGVMPPDPFAAQGYMYPHPIVPPQRDLADFGMGMNVAPPMMGREEFEARKVDLRMKHENERRFESKEHFKDRDYGREMSTSADVSSMKLKHKSASQTSSADPHHHSRPRSGRSPDPPRPLKRKSEHRHQDQPNDDQHRRQRPESSIQPPSETTLKSANTTSGADRKHKSVFSRISYPENEIPKKQKISSVAEAPAGGKTSSNGYYDDYKSKGGSTAAADSSRGRSSSTAGYAYEDHESSDEDRHFKRKPKRYEPSDRDRDRDRDREETRQPRGSRERSSYDKHNR